MGLDCEVFGAFHWFCVGLGGLAVVKSGALADWTTSSPLVGCPDYCKSIDITGVDFLQ